MPIFTELFKLHSRTYVERHQIQRPLAEPKPGLYRKWKLTDLKPCHSPCSIRIRLTELPRWFDNLTTESVVIHSNPNSGETTSIGKKTHLVSNLYITLCQLRLVHCSRQIMPIRSKDVLFSSGMLNHTKLKKMWKKCIAVMKALQCLSNAGSLCLSCLSLTGVGRGSSPTPATLWYDRLHHSIHFGLQAEHILKLCTGNGWHTEILDTTSCLAMSGYPYPMEADSEV